MKNAFMKTESSGHKLSYSTWLECQICVPIEFQRIVRTAFCKKLFKKWSIRALYSPPDQES